MLSKNCGEKPRNKKFVKPLILFGAFIILTTSIKLEKENLMKEGYQEIYLTIGTFTPEELENYYKDGWVYYGQTKDGAVFTKLVKPSDIVNSYIPENRENKDTDKKVIVPSTGKVK